MALSNEKENFVKIARIVLDVVPCHLRKLFITKWEKKYPNEKWQSNNISGNALVAKIAKVDKRYADKLKAGDEQQWDTTILVYVFLYSNLNLIEQCRNPKETRIPPLRISEEIDIIRETRNEFFGHATQMSCPSRDFSAIVDKLKSVAKNIFGADAEKEIDDIRKVPIDTQSTTNLRQRLEDEKNRNDQFNQSLKEVKEDIEKANEKVSKVDEKVERVRDDVGKVRDDVVKVRDDVGKVRDDVGKVRDDVVKVQDDVGKVRDDVGKVQDDVGKVQDDVGKVRDDVGKVQDDVRKIKGDMEKLKNAGFVGTMQTQGQVKADIAKANEKVSKVEVENGGKKKKRKNGNKKKQEEVEKVRDDVGKVRDDMEKLKNTGFVGTMQRQGQPYTEEDIDDMKAKYKIKHQKHEIHKVNSNGRIILEEVDVEEFVVKLRMSDQMPATETLRGEADGYFEQLEGKRGCYIEMSELIDKNKRVTFVTGIAGSGKSVVVKQMTYKWANGDLFNGFKVCITFECRELNYFALHKGKRFQKDEMIVEFLKDKFGFYVKDSKNTLFIIDGFDELFDSNENESIIGQLVDLKKSKHQESKIIITGRPHIENMLKKDGGGNMGGLRKVEILGLSNEQIDEYIRKFASSDENKEAKIKKVKDSSKSSLKLCHVPQFLNSICCVALLSDETEIRNAAELYCWSTYLMFRQHADKDGSHDKKIPEIFNEYSQVVLVLSKICHELLNKNSIIFEGSIKFKFDKIEKGKEFLSSLFVDVSNDFKERKQFKHLTLMEFLSAIYVCTSKEQDEIIKDILKKRSYQVLFFYCQLMSGLMYDGIIKNLFTNALKLEESDAKSFFCNILKLVRECVDNKDDESFKLSIDVIMCLMNADVINKQFILSIVNQLSFKKVGIHSSRNWIEMMKPLTVDFECSNDELKNAFENVHFGHFKVNELNELKYAKYFASVDWINLNGRNAEITTAVRDIRKEIDGIIEWVKVKRVRICNCKLEDKDIDDKIAKSSNLEQLKIYNCYVTEEGFDNLCKWMITVEEFRLESIKEMKVEWWNMLEEVIVNAKKKNDGDLTLKKLEIYGCPFMNDEIKKKIVQYGITLKIDLFKAIHPPPPIPPSLTKNRSPSQSRN